MLQKLPQGGQRLAQFLLGFGGGVGPQNPQGRLIALNGAGAYLCFLLADGGNEGVQLLPMLSQRLFAGLVNAVIQRGAGLFQRLSNVGQHFQLGFHPAAEGVLNHLAAALFPDTLGRAVRFQFIGKVGLQQVFVQRGLFPEGAQLLLCAGLRRLGFLRQLPQLLVFLRELGENLPQIDGRSGGGYGIV